MPQVTQEQIDEQVAALLVDAPEGEDLDELTEVYINIALSSSAMSLDVEGTRRWMARALELGATRDQVHEIVTLVSGMGVHTFFEASRTLDSLTAPAEGPAPFDAAQQELWDKYVGSSGYWDPMEEEIPGFLASLLRMSPKAFEAFFTFAAVPFRMRSLSNATKELISMTVDACPAHRYLPGMRLHLRNSLGLGHGSRAILGAIRVASQSSPPQGVL